MTKVSVYNLQGKEVGEVELNPKIFGLKVNQTLVTQAVLVQQANDRQVVAHTKTKGEVRGGGKKPWTQKGTGRARHGSIRSPQWKGGGVVFGPRSDRNFELSINKKQKRKALLMSLSDKLSDNKIIIVDSLALSTPKTKELANGLSKLKIDRSALITTAEANQGLVRASQNLKKIAVIRANSLNILDVISHKHLVLDKASLDVIEKTFTL